MSTSRFAGILLVAAAVSVAWFALGTSMQLRTGSLDDSLSGEIRSLWGPESLVQAAPYWIADPQSPRGADRVAPSASEIAADIRHDHRDKGLLWYSTFTVDFTGRYTLPPAADAVARPGTFRFRLPRGVASYDNLTVGLDGDPVEVSQADVTEGTISVEVARDAEHVIEIHYATGGQDRWLYVPGDIRRTGDESGGSAVIQGTVSELSNFRLTVKTDFADIDYPKGSRSPVKPAEPANGGMTATWAYERARTSHPMGIEMPRRVNAGPITARMSFFAPVSLAFFFTVLFTVMVLKKVDLHPMHYLFIAAGFFAFHILMAYLADVVVIHAAFWIAAAVSVLLVASYMRLVAGMKFTLAYVSAAQVVYLIGFSYAFFWVGRTGLTVTIGAIVTLFVLMQATGRVNWNELFAKRDAPLTPPPLPAAGPVAGGASSAGRAPL